MVPNFICRLILLIAGVMYPAYSSYKAVKMKNTRQYVIWMMYWIVFALFIVAEILADIFISFWFPFYNECKILFILWLVNPLTKGSVFMYTKVIHPFLINNEEALDNLIFKVQNQGYVAVIAFLLKVFFAVKDAASPYIETYMSPYLRDFISSLVQPQGFLRNIAEENIDDYRDADYEGDVYIDASQPHETFEMIYALKEEPSSQGSFLETSLDEAGPSEPNEDPSSAEIRPLTLRTRTVAIKNTHCEVTSPEFRSSRRKRKI